jgi:hypothetical protein
VSPSNAAGTANAAGAANDANDAGGALRANPTPATATGAATAASDPAADAAPPPTDFAALLAKEAAAVKAEVEEIELLINQAKTEAARHETRRGTAAEKLNVAADRLATGGNADAGSSVPGLADLDLAGPLPPGVSRIILTAQEDLRREIARQMHDGPAQSLTNIVLQAQIVDRLMTSDPAKAQAEVEQLIEMVQRTLDATKTFIFDVRPMVLDDLGLVPTLRRASRDRGRRVGVTVDFESVGVDRRLPVDLESGLFRMLDDALAAHVLGKPDRLALHLDWGEHLIIELTAGRTPEVVPDPELPPEGSELPPALAQMVAERRAAYEAAVEEARIRSLARLPEQAWRDVSGRARILGVKAEMLDDGARLHLEVDLPSASESAALGASASAAVS